MTGAAQTTGGNTVAKPTIVARLKAWWEGYDAIAGGADGDPDAGQGPHSGGQAKMLQQLQESPATRLAIRERIFGAGNQGPATDEILLELVTPLALDGSKSVVDFYGRIGTLARVMARDCGAWVDFVEPEELYLDRAIETFKEHKLSKKIKIAGATLEEGDIKEKSRDALVSVEGLSRSKNARETLTGLKNVIKDNGHIVLIDVLMSSNSDSSPNVSMWNANEGADCSVMQVQEMREQLKELGLKVHVLEDITDEYCKLIVKRLEDFRETLVEDPLQPEFKDVALKELDYWARRSEILQSGDLNMYRIHSSVPVTVD